MQPESGALPVVNASKARKELLMRGLKTCWRVMVVAAAFLSIASRSALRGAPPQIDEEDAVTEVRAVDIPRSVQIIGSLGRPLGLLVTVRGVWLKPRATSAGPPKDGSLRCHITHVNGERLAEDIVFHHALVVSLGDSRIIPEDGKRFELRCYETGGMRGIPAKAREELRAAPAVQQPYYASGYRFITQLEYLSYKSEE